MHVCERAPRAYERALLALSAAAHLHPAACARALQLPAAARIRATATAAIGVDSTATPGRGTPAAASRFRTARLARRSEFSQRLLEVGDEIAGVLEPDMQPHRGSAGIPLRRSAAVLGMNDGDQAFKAAPTRSDPE